MCHRQPAIDGPRDRSSTLIDNQMLGNVVVAVSTERVGWIGLDWIVCVCGSLVLLLKG